MEAPTPSPLDHQTATEILSDLIWRAEYPWARTNTQCKEYTTNTVALHYTTDLNAFRPRAIDDIIVLGLGGLGTVEQQHP